MSDRFLAFLQNITMGPAERHRRATTAQEKIKRTQRADADKVLAYPLFLMCMSATTKLNKCRPLLREIADLDHEQPVPLELRMAVKECLRELEKEETLCH